jgi:hypothetical protein
VIHDAEEVFLSKPRGEELSIGRIQEERLLGYLCDDVLYGRLHCLLDMAEVDGLAEAD